MEILKKMGGGAGVATATGEILSYSELKEKLAEIQKKLLVGDLDPRDQETMNVEYEKLTAQLEKNASVSSRTRSC